MSASASVFSQSFFHGTRADLKPGDLIAVGYQSNFAQAKPLSWVYSRVRWMLPSGGPSRPPAAGKNGSTSWSQLGRSWTIRT